MRSARFVVAAFIANCASALIHGPALGQGVNATQDMLVLSSSEDSGGTKQEGLNPEVLRMLERRSVELLEAKMAAYLKSQGQSAQVPKLQSEAHYMQAGAMKLAVVRVKYPQSVNQVFVYGIRGSEFHRVACARTSKFEESIPLFSGPCGDRVRQVFGVSIPPR